MNPDIFNTVLGIGVIILQIKALYLIFHLIFPKKVPIPEFAKKHYLLGITLLAFLGIVGSLVYSEVVGFPPCDLCWYQRIAIYSIGFIGLTALVKRYSKEVVTYMQVLSGLGLIIAIMHVIQEQTGVGLLCSSSGVSCSKQLVYALGYISIPMMSLSILLVTFLVTVIMKKEN